jgi:hypothetical protein
MFRSALLFVLLASLPAAVHLQEYENSYHFLVAYLAYLDVRLGGSPQKSP